MENTILELIELSHDLGREDRHLAILGEGNASAKLSGDEFAVKASGCNLATLKAEDVTMCRSEILLPLLDKKSVSDEMIGSALMEARRGGQGKRPSVESMFHAWLLTLPGVNYVGHCHPLAVNQILCSPRARDFAERRLCPDEVVCCGPASVFVPYVDPGLVLAQEIRNRTNDFIQKHRHVPRLVVLQNHGIIAIGATPSAVLASILMADKAAAIFMGAAALGGPVFMTPQHVERISARPDEAYRQMQLKI